MGSQVSWNTDPSMDFQEAGLQVKVEKFDLKIHLWSHIVGYCFWGLAINGLTMLVGGKSQHFKDVNSPKTSQ